LAFSNPVQCDCCCNTTVKSSFVLQTK